MINSVTLIGRITKDLELKRVGEDKCVVNFTLALNPRKDQTYFINCIAWNKVAEILVKYEKKGSQIGVNGMITQSSYQNKDGRTVNKVEVLANSVEFLGGKSKEEGDYRKPAREKPAQDVTDDDQLPF